MKYPLPHQPAGTRHLLSMPFGKPHALLADEPGTGKTFMTICAAKQAQARNGIIVCPPVIKEQWASEMVSEELAALDEIQVLYGLDAKLDNRPWKILNYELAREPAIRRQFLERDWHALIMDEAHRLKTHTSQQTLSMFHKDYGIATKCYWKWALSGTIMPNRPVELYPLLKTMAPEVIAPHDNYVAYQARYCGGPLAMGKGASNIPELTERLQPFMLKRDLADVWRDCPELHEREIWLDCSQAIAAHPEWADAVWEATERRVVAEAKAPAVAAYLRQRLDDGIKKITVFCYHKNVVEILANNLRVYGVAKINGTISASQRLREKEKFLKDPACRVFLVQYASGGEGLDGLQNVCAELVEAEPEWSPGREDQAIRRILRIGQANTVILTKLYAAESYEEAIAGANKRKRKVIEIVTKSNGGIFDMSLETTLERIAAALEKIAATQTVPPQAVSNVVPIQAAQHVPAAAPASIPPVTTPAASPAVAAAPDAPAVAANHAIASAPVVNAPLMDAQAFMREVTAKVTPLGEAAGMAKLQAVNAQFGVQKASDLPPVMYGAYLALLSA